MLARVGATESLAVLVFAVDCLHHQLAQLAAAIARQQRIPVTAPDRLDDIPAGATELALQFLDDLAVAAHRAIAPLQIAVDEIVRATGRESVCRYEEIAMVAVQLQKSKTEKKNMIKKMTR